MTVQAKEKNSVTILKHPEKINDEAQTVLEQVRRWGNAASDAVLDPACALFRVPNVSGVIGYRNEAGCAVVFGDPICAPSDIPHLVQAFHAHCQEQGRNPVYLTASENFAKWAIENACGALIEYGEELVIDPHCDPRQSGGENARLVRRKVNHAKKEGAVVKEYVTYDLGLEKAIEEVGKSWLRSRHGLQIHISHVNLFDNRPGKRWFYAQQGDRLVGVVLLSRLQSQKGWLLNHLMHTSDAPHGIPELLLVSVLETLANEDCHYVSFGQVSAKSLGEVVGLNKFSSWLAGGVFKVINRLFRLDARKRFWEKFHPDSKRSYILFGNANLGFHEIMSLMRALNVTYKSS